MAPKLHGLPMSTCTARVLACLYEKGAEFEIVPVNLQVGAHKQQPFLSLNPFGQIPAFEDGDLTLFESRAITKYIAMKHDEAGPHLVGENLAESAAVAVWLEVEAQHYSPSISPLVFELLIKPVIHGGTTDAQAAEGHAEKLGKVLDVYEERLSKVKYLAGDKFSLADLHHLPYTFCLMKTSKADLITSRPHVKAWWEDISSRPAWLKTAEGMKVWDGPKP